MITNYKEYLDIAVKIAQEAGDYLYKCQPEVNSREGKDVKLKNDIQSEKIIVDELMKTGIQILSEESGLTYSNGGSLRWIVDPIDGSANYMSGMRELTCVSIALWDGNEPLIGVINRYQVNEIFTGVVGEGAYLNGSAIYTSGQTELSQAILATGFPLYRNYDEKSLSSFVTKVQCFKKIRMFGTAALMGTFVANGRVDAYTEEDIKIWDIAAATAIVKAAGGYVNNIDRGDNKYVCELFATEHLYRSYKQLTK